ncbi:MAG: hypothetical protein OJF49_003196 [Ktedonobacterales bacterium]|nr:MAG: hypothetical protein OJF49_003196 [Ktedonobacterales bacterium]
MSKFITISLPDDAYEALKAAGEQAHQSPEEIAATAITERFSAQHTTPSPEQQAQAAKEEFLAMMRSHGYLVDPKSLPPYPGVADLPPTGSPERAKLEEEVGNALSDALEQSGLSILDLIERR